MSELLWVLVMAMNILAISDVLNKLTGKIEKFLWCVAIIALPGLGAGLWISVTYVLPRQKKLERENRKKRDKVQ